jgi:hypothetical protein
MHEVDRDRWPKGHMKGMWSRPRNDLLLMAVYTIVPASSKSSCPKAADCEERKIIRMNWLYLAKSAWGSRDCFDPRLVSPENLAINGGPSISTCCAPQLRPLTPDYPRSPYPPCLVRKLLSSKRSRPSPKKGSAI